MKTIAQRLRLARESVGMSQDEVASKLDLGSHAAYGNYERGITEPNIDNLMKLTKIFNKPLVWFLGIEDTNGKNLSPDEIELLDRYRKLPANQKPLVIMTINSWINHSVDNS